MKFAPHPEPAINPVPYLRTFEGRTVADQLVHRIAEGIYA